MAHPAGFSEEPQPFESGADPLRSVPCARLKIDSAGRIVIPAAMRDAMMVEPGGTVTCEVVDGEFRALSRSVIFKRLRAEAEKSNAKYPGSAVDELISDRREEARREDERYERIAREAEAARKGTERP